MFVNVVKASFSLLMFVLSLLVSVASALLLFFVALACFTAMLACVPVVITLILSGFAVDSSGEYLGLFESEDDE